MTNKQILETAIQKAIDGGWKAPSLLLALYSSSHTLEIENQHVEMVRGMITSHNFAKALWGEDTDTGYEHECDICLSDTVYFLPTWQYQLQQMVIAEDPLAYLGEKL